MNSIEPAGTDRSVGIAIIEAVAEKAAVKPTELPPLHESVDVDAIEALFDPIRNANDRTGDVRFPYAGYVVTVEFDLGTRTIHVESIESTNG